MHSFKKNIISNFFLFFGILFPVSLILGPTFIEIFSGLLIIFFFYDVDKDFYKKNKFYINIFLVFYLYIVIRSLFFSFEFEKIRSVLFYFRFLLFSCAIIFILERVNPKKKFNIKFIFFIFLLLNLDSILQYYFGKNIFNIPLYNIERASSFFGKELILGSFLFRLLPLILILCVIYKLDFNKNIFKLSIFFSFYFFAVLISGERTSIFLLLLTIFLLLILIKNIRKTLFCSLVFFIIIVFVSTYSHKNPLKRIYNVTLNQFFKVEKMQINTNFTPNIFESYSKGFYFFTRDHQGHYVIAIRMFLDNPIFGQGTRSFRYVCSQEKFLKLDGICAAHPHNTFLQLLAETGLVGFSFIFFFIIFLSKEIILKFLHNIIDKEIDSKFVQIKYISLIAIFVNLFPFAPSGNFFNNWLSFVYYYPIAFYIYSINKIKK